MPLPFQIVTSLVDLPGKPPPVTWRTAIPDVTKNGNLICPSIPRAAEQDLNDRSGSGIMQIYRDWEDESSMGEVVGAGQLAIPDNAAGADHPSNSLALVAAMIGLAQPLQDFPAIADWVFCGSVALDGTVLPPANPIALALRAKALGKTLVCEWRAAEIAAAVYPNVYGVVDCSVLYRIIAQPQDRGWCGKVEPATLERVDVTHGMDLKHVVGQEKAKYALEVAVAGGMHCLLAGPPGQGKSLIAACASSISPDLTEDEAIDVAEIWQGAGLLAPDEFPSTRPFRSTDSNCSRAALIGGGQEQPRPGEVSLSSHGVLLIDEGLQMPKAALESLRTVLQERVVTISRVGWKATYSAAFQLFICSNKCPCGLSGSFDESRCTCSNAAITKYRSRMSSAFSDRLSVIVDVEPQNARTLLQSAPAVESAVVKQRVVAAVEMQMQRQGRRNGELDASDFDILRGTLRPGAADAFITDGMSLRALTNRLRLARTVADLEQSGMIESSHVDAAVGLRVDAW